MLSKLKKAGFSVTLAGIIGIGATIYGSVAAAAGQPPADDPAWGMCMEAAARIEAEFGIPEHLLAAVTLTETGRRGPDRQIASWPWTVHDGKRGYHLASKDEAVALVRDLREGGRRSVDVGCMQVNLKHHPRAFTTIEDGFDPELNLRYAAKFLTGLEKKHGSWERAVARYHSYNPEFYQHYARKVLGYWSRTKKLAASATKSADSKANAEVADGAGDVLAPRKAPRGKDGAIVVASVDIDRENAAAGRSSALRGTAIPEPMIGSEANDSSETKTEPGLSDFFARTFGWPH